MVGSMKDLWTYRKNSDTDPPITRGEREGCYAEH